MVLKVVSESPLGVLSEKHNFDREYPGQNVKINNKNQSKLIVLWFQAMIFSLANKMIF